MKARVAVVRARWNEEITKALEDAALERARAARASVKRYEVAGSFELAAAVAALARTGRFDAVVPLGCLIRGETPHFEQLVTAYLDRMAAFDDAGPSLNAVRVLAPDALEQARAADRNFASGASGRFSRRPCRSRSRSACSPATPWRRPARALEAARATRARTR